MHYGGDSGPRALVKRECCCRCDDVSCFDEEAVATLEESSPVDHVEKRFVVNLAGSYLCVQEPSKAFARSTSLTEPLPLVEEQPKTFHASRNPFLSLDHFGRPLEEVVVLVESPGPSHA